MSLSPKNSLPVRHLRGECRVVGRVVDRFRSQSGMKVAGFPAVKTVDDYRLAYKNRTPMCGTCDSPPAAQQWRSADVARRQGTVHLNCVVLTISEFGEARTFIR